MVGAEHRFFVMFDHQQGITHVAQILQRLQQLLVVPLMQTDARLIQDVKDADETRADLSREPDALRFAARQSPGRPVE